MQNSNLVLFILGMSRSGTSFTAGWLKDNGLSVGDNLIKPNLGNIKGLNEDYEIFNLNWDVLKHGKLDWRKISLNQKISIPTFFEPKLEELVEIRNSNHQQWGFKDPKTLLFLPTYAKIIKNFKSLVIYRDFYQTVDSMLRFDLKIQKNRRNKLFGFFNLQMMKFRNKDKLANIYLESWIRYNSDLLDFLKDQDRNDFLILDVPFLLDNYDKILNRLNDWGFKLDGINPNKEFESNLFDDSRIKYKYDTGLVEKAQSIMSEFRALQIQNF